MGFFYEVHACFLYRTLVIETACFLRCYFSPSAGFDAVCFAASGCGVLSSLYNSFFRLFAFCTRLVT